MEGLSGPSAIKLDKSRVLDVKPLRTLVPIFSNPPESPPFVNLTPLGPFPSGFTPFYPFSVTQQAQEDGVFPSVATAVLLRSYGIPQPGNVTDFSELNGDQTLPNKQGSNSSQKKPRKARDASEELKKRQNAVLLGLSLSQAKQEYGSRELVNFVMLKFDAVRRRLSQLEESKEPEAMPSNRSYFLSSSILMSSGIRTNSKKRVGALPGVEIGDLFYFRMEMCVVGLHSQPMSGIDYMKDGLEEEGVAVSVVSSGAYDDAADDMDVLIYTGHGGGLSTKDKVATDQKLVRGNLALDRSSKRGNEIRVIRGFRDSDSTSAKIYVYDGLYSIKDSWIDKGKSGASTFKYKMVRVPGQPSAYSVWQSIQKWKQGIISRPGLIIPDLTSGAESVPVSLVNDIDYEKGPPYFTYTSSIRYSKSFNLVQPFSGCNCTKECSAGNLNCACIRKNGGNFPYTGNGILVTRKSLVYECGNSCHCMKNCKNKVLQTGLKARMEVFKTKDRGWGLRSWDPIRAGMFVCEYAGEVIDKAMFDRNDGNYNDYVFDTTRACDSSFKWNYDPGLVEEEPTDNINEESYLPSPLLISAKDVGNVSRFMNHSCSPNVLWQLIVTEENGESRIHVGFFAMRHIPPLTELTYDYGLSQDEHRRKQCLCGSQKCKGHFG
ncbi:hypothetical protein V2J09_002358 [Rumex salicifolius]